MLNTAQKQAVDYNQGHLLIVAGPGTGKTHTLTHRIAKHIPLLEDQQKVLAITFTQKASREMNERLQQLSFQQKGIDEDQGVSEKVFVGTFHQFCLAVLKQYATHLPKKIKIATEDEINALTKELWPEYKAHERKQCLQKISQAKSELNSVVFAEWEQYTMMLRKHGLLDYDDLLRESVLLFENQTDVLNQVQQQHPYVFVDEYQDINAMQHALLCLLVGSGNTITAIGDPHQAIYAFRGARVIFFNRFINDFKGAKILFLEENYRSCEGLLKAGAQVIAHDATMEVPTLTAHLYDQGRLIVYAAPTEKAEAEYVVHQIECLIGGTSMFSHDSGRVETGVEGEVSFADIAILYRLNSQSRALIEALERSGIPYGTAGKCKVEQDPYDLEGERVSLMTLHASKGLEFPVVFIVGCEEGLLPLDLDGFDTNMMEERRLFYVGMTRAKKILYLVRAEKRYLYGLNKKSGPSPMLSDIEESLKCYEKAKAPKPRPDRLNQMELF